MTNVKQPAWFKPLVRVAPILLLLIAPASLLAWFCGNGRMTGGGKLLLCTTSGGGMCVDIVGAPANKAGVTNGYELHCDGDLPNNLEVNDHLGNFKFKLETLQTADCIQDSDFSGPNPPAADFNTFIGLGSGTWSHGSHVDIPACAEWTFVDVGSGQGDQSYIRVTDTPSPAVDFCPFPQGDSVTAHTDCLGTQLLLVPLGTLSGQNQAHKN